MHVRLSSDGRLTDRNGEEAASLLAQPGEYQLLSGPYQTHLLARAAAPEQRARVLMMGELTHRMSVVEIVNVVTAARWTGELHVEGAAGTRVLGIAEGALKHARTSVESERLGELLVQAGLLERTRLRRLLARPVAPTRTRPLGESLVTAGILRAEQLAQQLVRQAETIFHAALLVDSGTYWFVLPPAGALAPAAHVQLPIHALLMEGVQRIDELAFYRERLPHNLLFPLATGLLLNEDLAPRLLDVLGLCDGARSIEEIARVSGCGEYLTVKSLHQLLSRELIVIQREARRGSRATRQTLKSDKRASPRSRLAPLKP